MNSTHLESHNALKKYTFRSNNIQDICRDDFRIPYFYQFLQISRAYREVHDFANGMGPAIKRNDFAVTLATYNQFGDVWGRNIEDWWTETAHKFLIPSKKPVPEIVQRVTELNSSRSDLMDMANLHALDVLETDLRQYLQNRYLEEGLPNMAILAVPLEGSRNEILAEIDNILKKEWWSRSPRKETTDFKFKKTKIRKETLKMYMFLVHEKAEHEYNILELGKLVTKAFEHEKLLSTGFRQEEKALQRQTFEELRFAYLISDWAALGQFPSKEKLSSVPISGEDDPFKGKTHFDWPFLNEQIANGTIRDMSEAF